MPSTRARRTQHARQQLYVRGPGCRGWAVLSAASRHHAAAPLSHCGRAVAAVEARGSRARCCRHSCGICAAGARIAAAAAPPLPAASHAAATPLPVATPAAPPPSPAAPPGRRCVLFCRRRRRRPRRSRCRPHLRHRCLQSRRCRCPLGSCRRCSPTRRHCRLPTHPRHCQHSMIETVRPCSPLTCSADSQASVRDLQTRHTSPSQPVRMCAVLSCACLRFVSGRACR